MRGTPKHYAQGKIEPIEVIEDWKLGFNLGNVIKYVARAEHKDGKLKDLRKALYYLNREVENLAKQEVLREAQSTGKEGNR